MKRLLILFILLAAPVFAVQPDEIMSNPVLEARARDISQGLRCLVCRNESIDDSDAGLARDIRLLVRERLRAGDSNAQVVAFMVSKYGEYVLLKPRFDAGNLLLWSAGPIMLLLGGGIAVAFARRKRTLPPEDLSEDEVNRLEEIMHD